jgi:hypothetical protein
MSNLVTQEGIGSFVTRSMTIFGTEVNTRRQLPSIYDGLKPAYRRILFEEIKTGTTLRKTADIVGSCMSTTHGHGDASMKDVVANLVRWGISRGQGNHGKKMLIGDDTEPSSMRYTEVAIADRFYNIFKDYMPYVDYVPADVKGDEPVYLPTPVPLCLLFGGLGIGIGVNCRIPAFEITSLINAYLNDDPNLLEAPFGLIINKEESELDQLWTTGVGKITYSFKVEPGNLEGSRGCWISGKPELFKPNLTQLDKLRQQGKLFILDQTKQATRLFIGREYNVKSISHEEIDELCRKAATNTRTYRLTVAHDDRSYLIPLYSWLNFTITNYKGVIERYKEDKIKKSEFDYQVYENLPKVVECLYNNRDWDANQIASHLNIDFDVTKAILNKSIGTLRKVDSTAKLEVIKNRINEYKSINSDEIIMDIINAF